MSDTVQKPLPEMSQVAKPFWEAAREGRFILQKCAACGKHVFFPRIRCPHCSSDQLDWVDASGRGTVYSYTVVVNNAPSAFINDMPYVVAIIQLDEGVRLLSNIVDCDPAEIRCEMPVEVIFEKLDEQFSLPKFKPLT